VLLLAGCFTPVVRTSWFNGPAMVPGFLVLIIWLFGDDPYLWGFRVAIIGFVVSPLFPYLRQKTRSQLWRIPPLVLLFLWVPPLWDPTHFGHYQVGYYVWLLAFTLAFVGTQLPISDGTGSRNRGFEVLPPKSK
jgi:hypothetical protein